MIKLVNFLVKQGYNFRYADPYLQQPLLETSNENFIGYEFLEKMSVSNENNYFFDLIFIGVSHDKIRSELNLSNLLSPKGQIFEIQNKYFN